VSESPPRTKELTVAKQINCDCGYVVKGADDDELVANAETHMREVHPEMAGKMNRDQILAMASEA
jgi:predicted small metal-binding protein